MSKSKIIATTLAIIIGMGVIITGAVVFANSFFSTEPVSGHGAEFTRELWDEYPNERIEIVDDMLAKHDLSAKPKEEVIELLGQPDLALSEDQISYLLGHDDTNTLLYLNIKLSDQGKVIAYEKSK